MKSELEGFLELLLSTPGPILRLAPSLGVPEGKYSKLFAGLSCVTFGSSSPILLLMFTSQTLHVDAAHVLSGFHSHVQCERQGRMLFHLPIARNSRKMFAKGLFGFSGESNVVS